MAFNTRELLTTPITGSNVTTAPVPPEGEYTAVTGDASKDENGMESWFRPIVYDEKDPETKQPTGKKVERLIFSVPFVLELSQVVKDQLGRQRYTCRLDHWLDFDTSGKLDMGKNDQLGRTREALGINDGAINWPDFQNKGPVKVIVKHRETSRGVIAYIDAVAKV